MSDRIEKSIELKAPIERVWRALTDHIEFGEWFGVKLENAFLPEQVVRGHITSPGYDHLIMEVKVEKMDAPALFSFYWHPYAVDPVIDYSQETPTRVEFRLTATAIGTRLVVVETGFDALPSHRRADAFRMNDSGWAGQMTSIQKHVEH